MQPDKEVIVPTVSVDKLCEIDDASSRLLQEIKTLGDRIARRAYDLYQTRGAADGNSADDWFRAEREVSWVPQHELQETDRVIHVRIGVSGMADKTIQVTLLPEMIILRGGSENESDAQSGDSSGESSPRVMLRQIPLPSQIHTESAVIRLEADLLTVSGAKAEPA
jgi:HSP20 family molecular chaperone IbpA